MCIRDRLGLAYGRKLGSKIDVGAQFNYNGIRIAEYGNAAALSFEIGVIMHLTDKLHTGIPVSYTHLRAHETVLDIVCRLLLEKKNKQ